MKAIEFEAQAILIKEDETELLRRRAGIAWVAVDAGPEAKRWLAHLWAVSAQAVKRLALIFETFGVYEITPDVPLKLYGAALETDDPAAWLERAIAEGWSPRQLRDAADILKGKHFSSCQFTGDRVRVTVWEPATGDFAVTGLGISGDAPVRARVTVREVLDKGE